MTANIHVLSHKLNLMMTPMHDNTPSITHIRNCVELCVLVDHSELIIYSFCTRISVLYGLQMLRPETKVGRDGT